MHSYRLTTLTLQNGLWNTTEMRTLIYTCNFGRYEEFADHKYEIDSSTDCVVFTDDPGLQSRNWNIVTVPPRFATDSIRDSRFHKIMGPSLFREYDKSLYLDNCVLLKECPLNILEIFLNGGDIGLASHSYRANVLSEFHEVLELGLDDSARVIEQLLSYEQVASDVLYERPYWCGIIARRHNRQVSEVMLRWWEEVLRYARRDQLSINRVLRDSNLSVNRVLIDNFESCYHKWPLNLQRKTSVRNQDLLAEVFSGSQLGKVAKAENNAGKLASGFRG